MALRRIPSSLPQFRLTFLAIPALLFFFALCRAAGSDGDGRVTTAAKTDGPAPRNGGPFTTQPPGGPVLAGKGYDHLSAGLER